MANEFIIKNGFHSKGDSQITGSLGITGISDVSASIAAAGGSTPTLQQVVDQGSSTTTAITASAISSSTISSLGDLTLDADGADILLKDGGTEFGRLRRSTSDFIIKSSGNNNDLIFKGVDDSATITALTLDMSEGGKALFNGGAQITGSLNISGSTTIELPTGTAFEILEGDKDQQSRLIFDYSNGDPTLTVASRASTAKMVLRQEAGTNGLYLDEDGQIYVNNSTSDGVKINGARFASIGTNTNALDLGSNTRPFKDLYLQL